MDAIFNVVRVIVIVAVALFGITFIVYFFNLDMKLTSALFPLFDKGYDKVKRDKHL